jgi:dynein heavy chain, axonemal
MLNEIYISNKEFIKESQGLEESISFILFFISGKIPKEIDLEKTKTLHELKYEDSMNTVLHQEIHKYNIFINIVQKSLDRLMLAIQGKESMDDELDHIAQSLLL